MFKNLFTFKKKVSQTIKSFVVVGDTIEVLHHGDKQIYKVEQFEVVPNSAGGSPTEFVIYCKFRYNDGNSSIGCTSDNFKYIKHIERASDVKR